MKKQLNLVLKKITEIIQNNYDDYDEGKSIVINSSLFNEIYCEKSNITTCNEHNEIFSEIKKIKMKPVLYWFSIDNNNVTATTLRNKYLEFKDLKFSRNSASYKPFIDPKSRTLYVGKVKKDFHLRLVTHLGYSKNKDTAGLQLFHWYRLEEFGNLTLNYIVFKEEMCDLITILEMELARKLNPIIGKY
ncbi:MAG: hypothetical protein O9267_11375 [Flavobacterium sp.]|uniref:hypothetical protein n=1 Tax=Flavobacterium sp. TaxID=239 RepID=UPI0022BFFAEF|nr:hypothetical protein [Flavobacterium sp.]MCZ8198196.1 hypothetical protein [Flavobacterium sp.]